MGMICFPSANRFSRHCRNGVCPNVTADPINSSLCLALVMATLIRLQSCNSIPVCRWKTRDKTSTYLFLVHPCMHCTCKLATFLSEERTLDQLWWNAVLKWFLFTSKSTYIVLTFPFLLLLTNDTMMHFFSLPWYLSTVFTSTIELGAAAPEAVTVEGVQHGGLVRRVRAWICSKMRLCWCLSGVITPISSPGKPHYKLREMELNG